MFFINNWTANQHNFLQSSSLGKPHTARDVAPTPGNSAGSLHLEVPSAVLSRTFGCCPQFQNYDIWGGIWVSGKGRSHKDSDQASRGCGTIGIPFSVKKNSFTEMAVWQGALLWCNIQVSTVSGRKRWTLFVSCSRASRQYYLLTVCPWGMNSLWTTPWLSKKKLAWIWFSISLFLFSLDAVNC